MKELFEDHVPEVMDMMSKEEQSSEQDSEYSSGGSTSSSSDDEDDDLSSYERAKLRIQVCSDR